MSSIDYTSPREAARAFTPKLSALVESPLYDRVWEDPDLSKRDRSPSSRSPRSWQRLASRSCPLTFAGRSRMVSPEPSSAL